jgi:hypothetical protein
MMFNKTNLRNWLLAAGTSAILSSGNMSIASAPAGPPPRDSAEAFQKSDLVFLGQIRSVAKDKLGFDSLATVDVKRVWKGDLPKQVQVSGAGGTTYPARLFHEKDMMLFYIDRGMHADSYMDRVLPLAEASQDLKQLGKPSMIF